MDITLHLTPETESKLKEQAARTGKELEALALEAIQEKLAFDDHSSVMLPPDEWQAKFNEFLASLPRSQATHVDDSRESIYEGRGE